MADPCVELGMLLRQREAAPPMNRPRNNWWAAHRARAGARIAAFRSWARLLIVSSITILASFLGISDFVGLDGGTFPFLAFKGQPESFYMIVIVLMVSFYTAIIGLAWSGSVPEVAEFFYLLSSGCLVLVFTLLVRIFLPDYMSWSLWYFSGMTAFGLIGVLAYEAFLR